MSLNMARLLVILTTFNIVFPRCGRVDGNELIQQPCWCWDIKDRRCLLFLRPRFVKMSFNIIWNSQIIIIRHFQRTVDAQKLTKWCTRVPSGEKHHFKLFFYWYSWKTASAISVFNNVRDGSSHWFPLMTVFIVCLIPYTRLPDNR